MVSANLLVVDDDPTLRKLMASRLQLLAYTVFTADSGPKALDILQREEIDLLVTDYKMPRMNGDELIGLAIKADPMLQCIVVTGYSDLATAIDVMSGGALSYLQKPVDFKELAINIQKGLEKRSLQQQVQRKQQELEDYRDQLEELVDKRTNALLEMNQTLELELEERKRLENSLREAKIIAENASRAKSEFLANMSHEIRTPMTSAIGLLNLVLDTPLLPKQKTYLEMARISTVAMQNLLNDILDFSKIEAGKLTLESIAFDPRKIIKSVIDLQHYQAEEKMIELSYAVADDVPGSVIGDPNRLRQIVLNLVANAVKFTQYGEVVVNCRTEEETPGGQAAAEKSAVLHFSVRDTGIGIEHDKIELIFAAFTQADSSTTRKFGGVGLGLQICSKLLDMMGGRIWVDSKPDQGSTFHFICPFKVEPARSEEERKSAETIPFAADMYGNTCQTILLVEDDESNQWVIRELLQKEGYDVINVSDGATALQQVQQNRFDLILLDLTLPDIDGHELVRLMKTPAGKADAPSRRMPVVAMSGFVGDEEKQRSLDAGVDDFIGKPFSVEQLLDKVREQIGARVVPQSNPPGANRQPSADISVLENEYFNEKDALTKASGNRDLMIKRIRNFLQNIPRIIGVLDEIIDAGDLTVLEQEIRQLKDKALEIGATTFADDLFGLLAELRKNKQIDPSQLLVLQQELDNIRSEPKIQTLVGEQQ